MTLDKHSTRLGDLHAQKWRCLVEHDEIHSPARYALEGHLQGTREVGSRIQGQTDVEIASRPEASLGCRPVENGQSHAWQPFESALQRLDRRHDVILSSLHGGCLLGLWKRRTGSVATRVLT